MRTSDSGIEFIKAQEGFRAEAYLCPSGVPTIGYGHTAGVKEGQTCTDEQAEEWLREDLAAAERTVTECAGEELDQCQFDALVSFTFNVGAAALRRSTLLRKVKADPSDPSIRDEFGRWIYGGGRELPGLVARRKAEADLYFSEINQSLNN